METQLTFDDFPQHRKVDTSIAAAKSKKPNLARELNMVRDALRAHPEGLTDYEISQIVGILRTSAGARRVTLRDQYDEVEYTGFKRATDTGRMARVWIYKENYGK